MRHLCELTVAIWYADQAALQKLETQVSTGQAQILPSDDPDRRHRRRSTCSTASARTTQMYQQPPDATNRISRKPIRPCPASRICSRTAKAAGLRSSAARPAIPRKQAAAQQIAGIVQQLSRSATRSSTAAIFSPDRRPACSRFQTQGHKCRVFGKRRQGFRAIPTSINCFKPTSAAPRRSAHSRRPSPARRTSRRHRPPTLRLPISTAARGRRWEASDFRRHHIPASSISAMPPRSATWPPISKPIRPPEPPSGSTITPTGLNFTLAGWRRESVDQRSRLRHDRRSVLAFSTRATSARTDRRHGPQSDADRHHAAGRPPWARRPGHSSTSAGAEFRSLLVQANTNGTAGNGYTLQFVDRRIDVTPATKRSTSTPGTRRSPSISPAAARPPTMINRLAQWQCRPSPPISPPARTRPSRANNGLGVVDRRPPPPPPAAAARSSTTSGLQIVNGGQTYNISLAGDQTVGDLLNTLNGSGAALLAQINSAGTGINILSRLSGSAVFHRRKRRPDRHATRRPHPHRLDSSRSSTTARGCKPRRPAPISHPAPGRHPVVGHPRLGQDDSRCDQLDQQRSDQSRARRPSNGPIEYHRQWHRINHDRHDRLRGLRRDRRKRQPGGPRPGANSRRQLPQQRGHDRRRRPNDLRQ